MAGGGGRGLSQLALRYSGAIVGLRGASHDRRRRTPVVDADGCGCGFAGTTTTGANGAAAGFFFSGGGGGGGGDASGVAFLAVRRLRWRWYGVRRRRRPAMHPTLRRGAAADEA